MLRVYKIVFRSLHDIAFMVPAAAIISFSYVMLASIWEIISPLLLSNIVSGAVNSNYIDANKMALYYIIGFAIIQILQIIGSIADNNGIYEKSDLMLRERFVKKSGTIPLIDYENDTQLNIIERARQCVAEESIPNTWRATTETLGNTISIVGIVVLLAGFNIWLLPLAILGTMPSLFLKIWQSKKLYSISITKTDFRRRREDIWNLFTNLDGIKEIKSYNSGDFLKNKWIKLNSIVMNEELVLKKRVSKIMVSISIFKVISYIGSIVFAVYLFIKGELMLSQLSACFVALASIQRLALSLWERIGRLFECYQYSKDFYDFIDKDTHKLFKACDNEEPPTDELVLKNVNFIYPNCKEKSLDSINMKIRKNETIAIIGENGSGKTTLAKILLGLFIPTAGHIYLRGVDYGNFVESQDISKNFSLVSQNFVKYQLSLRDNISLSDYERNSDDDDIVSVIDHVGCGDLVSDAKGIDVRLGLEFGGKDLSGGQWQRIAIARGDFRKSEIIIMDEPTSAFDPLNENEFLNDLLELSKRRTSIIITHRLGLCPYVNRIFLLDHGRLVGVGSHNELIQKNEIYRNLYFSQEKWYRN